mgnify:CR=1 FL=1|tara:strand:- start:2520 stop:4892 length:2373 start_codon:yes stop_codon:yes gene_type:complete
MEGFIILILLTILALPVILLIWVKTSNSNSIREVLNKLNVLIVKVDNLETKSKKTEDVHEEEPYAINESLLTLMETIPDVKPVEKVKEPIKEIIPEIVQPITLKNKVEIKVEEPKQAAFVKPKKKRDIEKFIGENLINKIGIGILVLGISYFVRYAIDKDWISEVGRVAIGILSGGILTFIAHKIRKKYTAFSSVLVGGAMAVFYYSISIAFHDYQLFSQPVAFGLMALITGFSVLLSISYNRKELAILGLIGAFSTPLMVSNGGANYQVLFSYLAIVNTGMLVLAYFKKWNVVNILSLAFTVVMFGGWFVTKVVGAVNPPYFGAMLFAGLFYVIFFVMNIINNLKEKRKFKGYEFGLLLSTTALFYGIGMTILFLSGNQQYQGLFTIGLGVFNLLFAFPLFKRNKTDKSLIFLLIGLVLTFVSLAAPVQLSGNYITLFWTTEMLLLLWLGQKSNIKFMKLSSLIIMCLMLVSLAMDWQQIYFDYGTKSLPIIFNKGFLTTLFSIAGVFIYSKLLNNEKEDHLISGISVQFMNNMTKIAIAALIYVIGLIEIGFQVGDRIDYSALTTLSIMGYTYLFLLCLWMYVRKLGNQLLEKGIALVATVLLFVYPIMSGFEGIVRDRYLQGEAHFGNLIVQYLNLILIGIICFQLFKSVRKWFGLRTEIGTLAVWGLSIFGLVVASIQLNHLTLMLFFDQVQENAYLINKQTIKIGYPIVWGISSFLMMLVGMKYKFRTLRVISLTIFSVILFKLFLFDIKGASEAGKIVAFILLGVLLLVISFMYQKLKNLLLDN